MCRSAGSIVHYGLCLDFPALMDFLVAEIVGDGLFGNVFDGVLFRDRIVQHKAA